MSLSDADLAAMKEREAAATPGPWRLRDLAAEAWSVNSPEGLIETFYGNKPNAEFIAHAREDVPALVAEVEALRADNERKTQALVRTVAHEAELVALLDPDNDEAVEIVERVVPVYAYQARDILRALGDAANGEG